MFAVLVVSFGCFCLGVSYRVVLFVCFSGLSIRADPSPAPALVRVEREVYKTSYCLIKVRTCSLSYKRSICRKRRGAAESNPYFFPKKRLE